MLEQRIQPAALDLYEPELISSAKADAQLWVSPLYSASTIFSIIPLSQVACKLVDFPLHLVLISLPPRS